MDFLRPETWAQETAEGNPDEMSYPPYPPSAEDVAALEAGQTLQWLLAVAVAPECANEVGTSNNGLFDLRWNGILGLSTAHV